MNELNKDIVGWCSYCKDAIYYNDDYVIRKGLPYHTYCYDLIETDTFGRDINDNFTETEME